MLRNLLTPLGHQFWKRDAVDLSFIEATSQQLGFSQYLEAMPTVANQNWDALDLSCWRGAISKLRAGSARGIDGISAQELKFLPDSAVSSLASVCSRLVDGYPPDFMHGLICPLSKAGLNIAQPFQSRPIVVLPQLYRLWAAVCSSQVVRSLLLVLPQQITGLLPNQGAVTAAYQSQYRLEQALFFGFRQMFQLYLVAMQGLTTQVAKMHPDDHRRSLKYTRCGCIQRLSKWLAIELLAPERAPELSHKLPVKQHSFLGKKIYPRLRRQLPVGKQATWRIGK